VSSNSSCEREDIFALPWDDGSVLLYAPLRRTAAVVNRAAAVAAARALGGAVPVTDADQAVVRSLMEQGFLSGPAPAPPLAPADYVFRPYEVTLFPTSRCNLRCTYCYAEGGRAGPELSWKQAKAAIDLVAENAGLAGRDGFAVAFHGGGEPTLAWEMLTQCVSYAKKLAGQLGLKVNVYAASNGLLSQEQRAFIAEHFSGLNVSLDGPEDIHDRQRPRVNGGGSFALVLETVRFFERCRFPYGVRATVTSHSAKHLRRIVSFFRSECPSLRQLHVEPVWCCGRCQTSGERPPEDAEFTHHFLEAWNEAQAGGLRLVYSGARLDVVTNRFCAAAGDGFSVTPTGVVTSCFEVVDAEDSRAGLFHYGRFDSTTERYVFDHEKIAQLRLLTVDHLDRCRDCFCKWHCAGDCLAKALHGGAGSKHNGSIRCELNRALTAADLKRLVAKAQHAEPSPPSERMTDERTAE
jgi:uncharacterized protein